jgi:hypothetical protein
MKNNIVKLVATIIVCTCAVHSANCQTSPDGLAVSAEASFLAATNAPQLFLTVHLLNTTNHEIVVLTKNLQYDFSDFGVSDANKENWTVGYNQPGVIFQGHLVAPPLSDLSPVTIKSNEEAIITHLVDNSMLLKHLHLTKDTQITVCYAISSDWGSRFGTWNGSATSKPFEVSFKNK